MDPLVRHLEADADLKVTQDMAFISQHGMNGWRTGIIEHFLLIHAGSHEALLVELYFQIPSSEAVLTDSVRF